MPGSWKPSRRSTPIGCTGRSSAWLTMRSGVSCGRRRSRICGTRQQGSHPLGLPGGRDPVRAGTAGPAFTACHTPECRERDRSGSVRVRMRPVGTPQNPIRCRLDQCARKRNRIRERRSGTRDALWTAHLDPAPAVRTREIHETPKRLLVETRLCRHAAHVVDDKRRRQLAEQTVEPDEVPRVEMQHDVPAKGPDAVDDAMELGQIRLAAQMLHEIETNTPEPAVLQCLEISVAEGIVDVRDAPIPAAALRDGVQDHPVVRAIAARINQNGTFETEDRLQRLESL